jgi:hypothetical protein
VLLVTIWQSLAQLNAAYGPQSDTILTNHLTKVMYAGLSDPASLGYVDRILGQAEVDTRSRTAAERLNGGSDQYSTTQVPLAPAHVLRQMRPGDALLVHGTLRRRTSALGRSMRHRIWLSAPPWSRASSAPGRRRRREAVPATHVSCPVGPGRLDVRTCRAVGGS